MNYSWQYFPDAHPHDGFHQCFVDIDGESDWSVYYYPLLGQVMIYDLMLKLRKSAMNLIDAEEVIHMYQKRLKIKEL